MKIAATTYQKAARAKNIFISLFQKEPLEKDGIFARLSAPTKRAVKKLWQEEFRAEESETKSIWFPHGPVRRVRLFGLGEKDKWNHRQEHFLARRYVRYAKSERINEFAASLDPSGTENAEDAARLFATNAVLADFDFNKYKERPKDGWPEIKTIYLAAADKEIVGLKGGIQEGAVIGEETNTCRELANTPGGDMTPEKLAHAASLAGKKTGIKVKILGEGEMQKLGMGGILGVSRGSPEKPNLIVLEYKKGPAGQRPLVLVGKGVTFDSGGLNLKPEQAIYEMHMDMSGGAAVIHGIAAIARLKIPVNAIGIVPAVENMTSGSSYRPGDLLKTMSGKTIEVLNTDAEGRIILADALYYGTKYKPGFMINFATLTGAAHVALGDHASALFTKNEAVQNKLIEVGKKSGDYVWPLPMWDEYFSDIKGTFGDIANSSKTDRYGGAIHGAKFLEQFVGDTAWAHIDIAPRMTTTDSEYLAKGASGVGVRYIVELAKSYPALL